TREGLRQWFGIAEPRIALCALNPHAGDGGRFGREDDLLLTPAAREARVAGPFPADTVFVRAMRGERHARAPVPADLTRSRHRARHRGAGPRRPVEHDRVDPAVRGDRTPAA